MSHLHITTNLDLDPWLDLLEPRARGELIFGEIDGVGILPAGMQSGRASIAFRGATKEGRPFVVEIAWAMLQTAVIALAATPTAQMEGM